MMARCMSPPSPEHAVRLVILREHPVCHMNGIGHLRRDYQVHLEQAGLQWALLLRVALEDVELVACCKELSWMKTSVIIVERVMP